MTHKPCITVCMPVYNSATYLKECIDSVLSQSFEDFEFLIVDDGSTDNSVEIIRSYSDSRIRLIKNKHDYINSLNLLLHEARGKYIARMDSDDLMTYDRLKVQFEYMETHPNVGVLGTAAMILGSNDTIGDIHKEQIINSQMLLAGNPIIHPSTIIRKNCLSFLCIEYDKKFIYAEDYCLWCMLYINGVKLMTIPFVGIQYRVNSSQVTVSHRSEMELSTKSVQEMFAKYLCCKYNSSYHTPKIKDSSKKFTIIIPFLNEGNEVIETVKSIRQSVGLLVDIIVINDFSTDEVDYQNFLKPFNVYYVLNSKRKGVAASRDRGVRLCKTPFFLLLDAHMRVYNNLWLYDMVTLLEKDDRQLLCAQTRQLWRNDNNEIIVLKNVAPVYGAYATFPKDALAPNIEWNYMEKDYTTEVQNVPCVLGAGYATSKRYWLHLKGLTGLEQFGCDEDYISLKVWYEGGKCVLLKKHEFGHIYRNNAPYPISSSAYVFNYLLIAYTLLPTDLMCWCLASCKRARPNEFQQSFAKLMKHKPKYDALRAWYKEITHSSVTNILSINRNYAMQCIKDYDKRLAIVDRTFLNIKSRQPANYGVVDGVMSYMIWLTAYEKYKNQNYIIEKSKLLNQIEDAIEKQILPFNFRYGATGIGWALIYLSLINEISGSNIPSLLYQIDTLILTIDVTKIPYINFLTGIGGIMAYATAREIYCSKNKIESSLSPHFLKKLNERAAFLIKEHCDFSTTYYANLILHLKSLKQTKEYRPYLQEWLNYPMTNPTNERYWSYSLDRGCLGYSLLAMNNKSIINN